MTKPNHHRRRTHHGETGRGASVSFECLGGCGLLVPDAFGVLAYCGTCFYVSKTLRMENALDLRALLHQEPVRCRATREATLGRVSDLLRRTGVDDAEVLIRALELL